MPSAAANWELLDFPTDDLTCVSFHVSSWSIKGQVALKQSHGSCENLTTDHGRGQHPSWCILPASVCWFGKKGPVPQFAEKRKKT